MDWFGQLEREEASDCAEDAPGRAASCLLAELARGEPEHETVDHDAAQVLVPTPAAFRGRAAVQVHHRTDPRHLVGLPRPTGRDDGLLDRTQLAATPCPQRQMVSVRNVDGEVEVAPVERADGATELGGDGIRASDTPVQVQLVIEASVHASDETVERRSPLGHSRSAGLQQDRHAVVTHHELQDS